MDTNSELARLYEGFKQLSSKQRKEIIKTVETLLEQQKEKQKTVPSGRQKEKHI